MIDLDLPWTKGGSASAPGSYACRSCDALFKLDKHLRSLEQDNKPCLAKPGVAKGLRMCKHILNAQVSIRSPCCRKWFDCAECHQEQEDHELLQKFDMTFACKKCKKCFRKDTQVFEESDEYCPHCDNHFVLEAKIPTPALNIEGEDARIDARMIKDDRIEGEKQPTIFNVKDAADRLG